MNGLKEKMSETVLNCVAFAVRLTVALIAGMLTWCVWLVIGTVIIPLTVAIKTYLYIMCSDEWVF